MKFSKNNITNIAVLGTSFDTGNLGVSALAVATISLIKQYWPEAQVCLLGGREFKEEQVNLDGLPIKIEIYPVRYCSNIFVKNHLWKLLAAVVLRRITHFPFQETKKINEVVNTKTTLQALLNADLICDITGGDSFSDIYGMSRFARGYLLKRVCQISGKPFIMLPQTYGPFKSLLSRWMAKRVLQKAQMIYSRDKEGLKTIKALIGNSEKVQLCPDVAFTLKPNAPIPARQLSFFNKQKREEESSQLNAETLPLIGLNVSGLLYNGGYTGKNEFGIKGDYRKLIREIIDYFVTLDNVNILLVPHVIPIEWEAENDLIACRKLRDTLPEGVREKVFIAEPEPEQLFYDQCEIKYLIGQCTFFLGSRMHATIAAISQCIPTIGLAYSKKFAGVYETAGVEECVADLRTLSDEEIMDLIKMIYGNKELIKAQLEKRIPTIKEQVYSIFEKM